MSTIPNVVRASDLQLIMLLRNGYLEPCCCSPNNGHAQASLCAGRSRHGETEACKVNTGMLSSSEISTARKRTFSASSFATVEARTGYDEI